jgi:ketosteroid isomerase-like protein
MGYNAELVRRAHAAYASGFKDRNPSEVLSLVDPMVEWQEAVSIMEGNYRGHEGVRRWMEEFWESWDELQLETLEVIEGEANRVFATVRIKGRGKASGAPVGGQVYEVIEVRDRLMVKRLVFPDRETALEAAGLTT